MTTAIIIDDDKSIVDLFTEFLELEGYSVLGKAHNGKDAAELYQKYKPDVVLLDVMMPEYDGIYGLQKIREIDPKAPVIMVTADMRAETADKLEHLNASAIIFKPFEITQLLSTITKVIDTKLQLEILSIVNSREVN